VRGKWFHGGGPLVWECPECGSKDVEFLDDGFIVCRECGLVLASSNFDGLDHPYGSGYFHI